MKYLLTLTILLTGCASIVSGTTARITVETVPDHATIEYRGETYGSGDYIEVVKDVFGEIKLTVSARGYKTREIYLDKKLDIIMGVCANLACTNGLGVFVDVATGALMDVRDTKIRVTLRRVK